VDILDEISHRPAGFRLTQGPFLAVVMSVEI
jgi:hypothetical protein